MWAGDVPDDRWSLVVYGDSTGLRYRNKESDPMPIKTLNNNGLKVYEETEDYFIQIDKDAVITTVEKYVPGTFYIYNERLKDVEKSRELLTLHKITWDTNIDNAKLLLDVNKEQLEKLANTPTLLEDEVMPVLETRAIPTNYECCVRTDKNTGEMYIDEGYENVINGYDYSGSIIRTGGNDRMTFKNETASSKPLECKVFKTPPSLGDYIFSFELLESKMPLSNSTYLAGYDITNTIISQVENVSIVNKLEVVKIAANPNTSVYRRLLNLESNQSAVAKSQLTKTSTLKPFVKTIMPNGKLEFLSGATELTHTFLTKGDGVITFGSGSFSLRGEKVKQLLVYKGLLTEQEKQAELAKDIRFRR